MRIAILSLLLLHCLCVGPSVVVGQEPPRQALSQLGDYRQQPGDDAETKLLKERVRAAKTELAAHIQRAGETESFTYLQQAQSRFLDAQIDFHKNTKEVIPLLEKHVELAKGIEAAEKLRLDAGSKGPDDLAQAVYWRAGVELELLRAKRKHQVAGQRTGDDEEAKLLKERLDVAKNEVASIQRRVAARVERAFFLTAAVRRLMSAQIDFYKKPNEIIPLLEQHVELARRIEAEEKLVVYWRAGVELELLRAKRKHQVAGQRTGDDEEAKLLKERVDAAKNEVASVADRSERAFSLVAADRRLMRAQIDFYKKPNEIIPLLEQHVELARRIEAQEKLRFNAGLGGPHDFARATHFRAGVELELLRAKRK